MIHTAVGQTTNRNSSHSHGYASNILSIYPQNMANGHSSRSPAVAFRWSTQSVFFIRSPAYRFCTLRFARKVDNIQVQLLDIIALLLRRYGALI